MPDGYAGKILRVDLSEEEIVEEKLDKDLIDDFIGGWGINVKLFHDFSEPKISPFQPGNPIILGVGPLVGTTSPGATKLIGTTRAAIVDGEGRHFIDNAVAGTRSMGIELKKADYDHVVITGRASNPVFLKISSESPKICDATDLWSSSDTYQATDELRDEYGRCGVISIGEAGEKLVRYAMAMVDYSGTLGKFGLGAVMGSKNLKAVVAKGEGKIDISDPRKFENLTKSWRADIDELREGFPEFGKRGINAGWKFQSDLILEGEWDGSTLEELYGYDKYLEAVEGEKNKACFACPLPCRSNFKVDSGRFEGTRTYTAFWFIPARMGQRLGLEDWRDSIKLLDICNRKGMCAFTASGIVNWVTRLYEEDIISEEDVGGRELNRDMETYLDLFEKIGTREGFGRVLGEGWYPVGEEVGVSPEGWVWGTGLVQGADVIQDARVTTLHPQGFTHLTGTRPHHGGHQSLYTLPDKPPSALREDAENMGLVEEELERIFVQTPEYGPFNVGRYAKHVEDHMAVMNSMGECIAHTLWGDLGMKYANVELLASLYSALTGIDHSARELKKKGERAFNLYRLLNVREGFSERGKVPEAWVTPRKTAGRVDKLEDYYGERELKEEDVESLLDDYYHERGWDPTDGTPKEEKLKKLGLV